MRAAPGRLVTSSLEETMQVARFMLCDRTPAAFSRLPSERDFADYVREVFWDEARGRGGWNMEQVFALVRPDPAWVRQTPPGIA